MGKRQSQDGDSLLCKSSLEFRNEAWALFIGYCKEYQVTQREAISDAIEHFVKFNTSENSMKRIRKSDEYKTIKKYGPRWKRYMPGAKKEEPVSVDE